MDTNKEIELLKEKITNICLSFNNLIREDNKTRRNSKDPKVYKEQKQYDSIQFNSIRNNALEIFDECNKFFMNR